MIRTERLYYSTHTDTGIDRRTTHALQAVDGSKDY